MIVDDSVRDTLEVGVKDAVEDRDRMVVPVTEGAGVNDSAPKTQLMPTATAAAYTESPVCVTVSVHVPPATVEFKYPVLKVPGNELGTYAQALVVVEATVTGRPLLAKQFTGTPCTL